MMMKRGNDEGVWARESLVWIGRMGVEEEVGYAGVVGVGWPSGA